MTTILILGGAGMLGHKLFQELQSQGNVFATLRDGPASVAEHPAFLGANPQHLIGGVDATNFDSVVRAVAQVRPDVLINCIGVIKQLREAHDPIPSLTLNALLPHRLADLCAVAGTRLIHISTDCVFSGRQGNYRESDVADAEDLYGRTKLLGEVDRPGCLTLRTSIIGRDPRKAVGLLEWFLGQEGRSVRGFTRAIYSGFPTRSLARIIGQIIAQQSELTGLYQVASPPINKYHLLAAIREAMDLDIDLVPDDAFHCDRSLRADRFIAATGTTIPDWPTLIADLLTDPTPYHRRESHAAT
jgi:dTDP-4-dehydrorhamnose reductase